MKRILDFSTAGTIYCMSTELGVHEGWKMFLDHDI